MNCLYCGHTFDKHDDLKTERKPELGDFSVCIECGSVHVFNDNLTIRKTTSEEDSYIENGRYPEVLEYINAVLGMRSGLN